MTLNIQIHPYAVYFLLAVFLFSACIDLARFGVDIWYMLEKNRSKDL